MRSVGVVIYGLVSMNSAFQGHFLVKGTHYEHLVPLVSNSSVPVSTTESPVIPVVTEIPRVNVGESCPRIL